MDAVQRALDEGNVQCPIEIHFGQGLHCRGIGCLWDVPNMSHNPNVPPGLGPEPMSPPIPAKRLSKV